VLRDHPRGVGPVFTDEGFSRPTVLVEHLCQPRGIAPVHFFHAWVVAVEQRSISGKLRSHCLILIVHSKEFESECLASH
jgi:hypothetical protein